MNDKTKDYTEAAASKLTDTMQDMQNRVGDTAKNVSYATDRYVRENPWKTIALVALGACLVGYMLSAARD